jgi:hypothetical protein
MAIFLEMGRMKKLMEQGIFFVLIAAGFTVASLVFAAIVIAGYLHYLAILLSGLFLVRCFWVNQLVREWPLA